MIQLRPDIQKATAWMLEQPRRIVRPGHDDGYGWHALVAAAFGDLAPKPFRLIEPWPERVASSSCLAECNKRPLQLLAYTSHDRAALLEQARLHAAPAVYRALGIDALDDKPMPAAFKAGQRLGFEVRVRPTVRQDYRDPETGAIDRRRSRERDAFLVAVDAQTLPRGQRPELVREVVYRDWLATRLGDAARLEPGSFRLAGLGRTMLLRPRQRSRDADPADGQHRDLVRVGSRKSGVKGEQGGSPDAIMQGTLIVSDPEAFHALLARGVGRHRAFGFGMLLLRPPLRR
jgi:CRISPR system Cascade subunit CasE